MLYTTGTFLCFRCLYLQYHQEEAQTEFFASAFASTLPASQDCLDEYRTAQQEDSTSRQLITVCQQGWPYRPQLKGDLSSYWHVRGDLTIHDNLLLYEEHCRKKMHNGHQDIQRCCQCTTSSVWQPGVSKHIEQLMNHAQTVQKHPPSTKSHLCTRELQWPTVCLSRNAAVCRVLSIQACTSLAVHTFGRLDSHPTTAEGIHTSCICLDFAKRARNGRRNRNLTMTNRTESRTCPLPDDQPVWVQIGDR